MQFFQRYHYIMLITFVLVSSAALILFYLQYQAQYRHEINKIKSEFNERVLHLDVLRGAKDNVESMKIKAETYMLTHPKADHSLLFKQLQATSAKNYSLDKIKPPFSEQFLGNLTGQGSLIGRDELFYRDIEMALELNSAFQMVAHNIPNVVWIYYTSANLFNNIYPWVHSEHSRFDAAESYPNDYYQLGLPEKNPKRDTFWTPAYIDGLGKGLMVTCGAPVYEKDHFLGTVALDLTLDVLNRFIQNFHIHSDNLFIINQTDQLISHSRLVSSQDKEVQHATIAFPESLREKKWQTLFLAPEAEFIEIDNYLLLYQNLKHVPWKLIFWIPKQQVTLDVMYGMSWLFIVLLFSVLITILTSYWITRQEFILPAQYLVEHIEAENQGISKPTPPVAKNWRVWFHTVSHIFTENRRLFAELKNYSASLEERSQIISERNEQLSLKNKELERLNCEKNEFLGIVAHDLKNPLSGILGLAELLADASESPDVISTVELQECATMIQSSANNMFQLITNLLDVNAIESGKINILLEPTDLSRLVRKTIRNYLERAARKNILIHFEAAPMLTYLVLADVQISQQILDNLVSNAVKYSPHGKNIYIYLTDTEHWVHCEIRDEGQGLTAEEQQKLFGKFTRLSAKPTGDEHSTGLGLFIVKKLVDAMHAKIRCHSEVGHGARFIVEFPKLRYQT